MDDEDYSVSDSEDDYSKEDKLLLQSARDSMRRKEISSDEEVYGFGASDSDEEVEEEEENMEEGEEDIDMGSDLEDERKPPDDRAWGKRKKSFYNTDFVDQDYEGNYQGEEAEIAELEEQEARNIQKRLAEQLNEADFSITEAINIAEATDATAKQEVITSDLTKLTERQKLDLMKKESPEFFVLVDDFKEKIQEAQKYLPVINYFKRKVKEPFPALNFLQIKLSVMLNYCTNISCYLLLKAKRIPVKNHPIMKSLFCYRQLLEQLEKINTKTFQTQFDTVFKKIKSGEEILINEDLLEKKTTLKVLTKKKRMKEKQAALKKEEEQKQVEEMEFEDDKIEEQKEPEMVKSADGKRAITYEMAKNKGLIPKRSKEQRNPRVKHRKKYEKAKIRRRGQVRTPRAEIPVYYGEPTGIKIGLTKSTKLRH